MDYNLFISLVFASSLFCTYNVYIDLVFNRVVLVVNNVSTRNWNGFQVVREQRKTMVGPRLAARNELAVCYFGRNSAKLISRPTVDSTSSDEVPREIPEEDIGTTERLGCARNSRDKMRVYIPCNRNVTLPCLVNFKPISSY